MTSPITEPRVSRDHRDRRLAPITIWVALSERAASTSASPASADDLVVGAAELLDEVALALEQGGGRRCEPVLGPHVDGDQVALQALGDAGGAAHEPLAVRRAGQRHQDTLAGFPGPVDAVSLPIVREALVDAVGQPEQRELPERREVAGAEIVGERGVDSFGRVDVSAREPVAEGQRGQVDELELVGAADDLVGDRLALLDRGDALDDVVQRVEMLNVEGREDVDPGLEQLVDVLPALLVPRARHVRVRELVDEGDIWLAGEHGVDVHLLEGAAAVLHVLARHDLEVADLGGRLRAAVRLDVGDDDVLAVVAAPPALVEHRVGLADARRGAEVDTERASGHGLSLDPVEREVQLEDVHAGLAEEAERALVGVLVDEVEHVVDAQAPRPRHPLGLNARVLG